MNLDGRNVLVVGLARTGEATAAFLLRRGARVTITEQAPGGARFQGRDVDPARVKLEAGGHTPAAFLEADLIIPSPGVPRLPEIAAARDRESPSGRRSSWRPAF